MKLLGLTGGIGMGKTVASRFFRERGAQVVDTDELAHSLVEPGQPALEEIEAAFGKAIIAPNGSLRRHELAQIVFSDPAARKKLEDILHPRIRESWRSRLDLWRNENHHMAVVVIPLLFETHAEPDFDKTVCVACSAINQQKRLSERGWSPAEINQRIAAQWPIERKMAQADFVVWTDGSLGSTAEQIERISARI